MLTNVTYKYVQLLCRVTYCAFVRIYGVADCYLSYLYVKTFARKFECNVVIQACRQDCVLGEMGKKLDCLDGAVSHSLKGYGSCSSMKIVILLLLFYCIDSKCIIKKTLTLSLFTDVA